MQENILKTNGPFSPKRKFYVVPLCILCHDTHTKHRNGNIRMSSTLNVGTTGPMNI